MDAEVVEIERALTQCCSGQACRRAAYDLLVDLMAASGNNMEEGSSVLVDLHYSAGPVTVAR